MPWLMAPKGSQRPYENKPPSIQGWGHQGCHHVPKLVLELNSVSLHWVLGLHPSLLHHLFLKGYPRELVRSSGMCITLDDVLTILDEHYNNVKALDALDEEPFQLCMGNKETVSDWGVHLSRYLQVLLALFPEYFPLDYVAKLLQWTP